MCRCANRALALEIKCSGEAYPGIIIQTGVWQARTLPRRSASHHAVGAHSPSEATDLREAAPQILRMMGEVMSGTAPLPERGLHWRSIGESVDHTSSWLASKYTEGDMCLSLDDLATANLGLYCLRPGAT